MGLRTSARHRLCKLAIRRLHSGPQWLPDTAGRPVMPLTAGRPAAWAKGTLAARSRAWALLTHLELPESRPVRPPSFSVRPDTCPTASNKKRAHAAEQRARGDTMTSNGAAGTSQRWEAVCWVGGWVGRTAGLVTPVAFVPVHSGCSAISTFGAAAASRRLPPVPGPRRGALPLNRMRRQLSPASSLRGTAATGAAHTAPERSLPPRPAGAQSSTVSPCQIRWAGWQAAGRRVHAVAGANQCMPDNFLLATPTC